MTPVHRADCEDCPWSFEDDDIVEVTDEMERHQRKEMHDVDFERAIATDGGLLPSDWSAVDAEPPRSFPTHISPRDLHKAVLEQDTLLAVTREIRSSREVVQTALARLDLLELLTTPDARKGETLLSDGGEIEDSVPQFDEDEVGKVRIESNDDPRREFSIDETTLGTSEILYLRLPNGDIRRLRDWANEELDKWEDYDPNLLRTTAAQRDKLEGAAETAVNDIRKYVGQLEQVESIDEAKEVASQLNLVAGHLENTVEGFEILNVDEKPEPVTDGGRKSIGDLLGASALNVEGRAVLGLKGTDETVGVHVPQDKVVALLKTVRELEVIYGGEDADEPIGDGGQVAAEDGTHHCDICDTEFDTVAELIRHDCDNHREQRVAADGGDADGE